MARPERNNIKKILEEAEAAPPKSAPPEEEALPKAIAADGLPQGEWTERGVFRMEREFAYGRRYGAKELFSPRESGETLRAWGGRANHVFMDTETTGLSGGTGTYAFLVGLGFALERSFRVVQFFLAGPAWERALLRAIEEELPKTPYGLVTYNGKSFDVPLLNARCTMSRLSPPWGNAPHVDLLTLSRHFYKERLPSCSLSAIEKCVLGLNRSGEDVPGREIPRLYLRFLQTMNARPLLGVFYHNTLDIVSLAALENHIAGMLCGLGDAEESVKAGDLLAAKGRVAEARELWRKALDTGEEPCEALARLGGAERSFGNHEAAYKYFCELKERARNPFYALEAMAKIEEHKFRDIDKALSHSLEALNFLLAHGFIRDESWRKNRANISHRIARLKRKASRRFEKANGGLFDEAKDCEN